MAGQSSIMFSQSWTGVSVSGSPPCCDLTLLHPFQPKLCPMGQFVWPKCYFQPMLAPLGHNFCHSWSSKCPELVCLVILSAISTFFSQFHNSFCQWPIKPVYSYNGKLKHLLASFGTLWPFYIIKTRGEKSKLIFLDVTCCNPSYSTPSNPKQALWADLCGPKAINSLFWPPWNHIQEILSLANWSNCSACMALFPFQPRSKIGPLNMRPNE